MKKIRRLTMKKISIHKYKLKKIIRLINLHNNNNYSKVVIMEKMSTLCRISHKSLNNYINNKFQTTKITS